MCKTRSEKHKAFVRTLPCAKRSEKCMGDVQCSHDRLGNDAGLQQIPSDMFILPLCYYHHIKDLHVRGEKAFWDGYDQKSLASFLWSNSGDTHTCTKAVNRFAATGEV